MSTAGALMLIRGHAKKTGSQGVVMRHVQNLKSAFSCFLISKKVIKSRGSFISLSTCVPVSEDQKGRGHISDNCQS